MAQFAVGVQNRQAEEQTKEDIIVYYYRALLLDTELKNKWLQQEDEDNGTD